MAGTSETSNQLTALHQLCAVHGVRTAYQDWVGQPQEVQPETLVKVLASLGVDAGTEDAVQAGLIEADIAQWRRMLPPCVVVREGQSATVPVHVPDGAPASLWIELEGGGSIDAAQQDVWLPPRDVDGNPVGRATFALPGNLPLGYHTLQAWSDTTSASATLVVVPDRLDTADRFEQRRGWGLATQLYSVRSKRSWGIGDFGDLADLAAISGERGADYILVNPLHAAEPAPPVQASPYSPSTRRFFHPLYIRVEAVAEFAYLSASQRSVAEGLFRDLEPQNTDPRALDRDATYAAKLKVLNMVYLVPRGPAREHDFQEFCRGAGSGLDDFALWSAIREDKAANDPFWTSDDGVIGSAAVESLRADLDNRIAFHRWLQWICDSQLAEAQRTALNSGMRLGVVHDLAVGADLQSADAWSLRDALAPGVSVGAPPDMYNQQGQDWNQPPWHPVRLAEAGYRPYAQMLSTVLRHAGGIRVDHILGLFRLWWVPAGNSPAAGAYVGYDHEALLGVLALEAHRAGAVVIGEDLGVFEPWVRDYLASRGILGTSILWFENQDGAPLPPEAYRVQALASVNTHDLPPTAGYLAGDHVDLREDLGLLERPVEEERAEHAATIDDMLALVRQRGLLNSDTTDEEDVIVALHQLLAQAPSVLLGVALVDAVGERRVQNQPGTTADVYPNWQVPLADDKGRAVLLDDLADSVRFNKLLAAVTESLR